MKIRLNNHANHSNRKHVAVMQKMFSIDGEDVREFEYQINPKFLRSHTYITLPCFCCGWLHGKELRYTVLCYAHFHKVAKNNLNFAKTFEYSLLHDVREVLAKDSNVTRDIRQSVTGQGTVDLSVARRISREVRLPKK